MNSDQDFVQSVIEALNHPFYVVDVETYQVVMANSAAYRGGLPEALTCYALTHRLGTPCDRAGETCPVAEIKRTGQPVFVEHQHYDANGRSKAFELRAFPVFDGEGRVTHVIECALDITDRWEAERLKDEFLSMISHEIRTPLHHIKGFASTLLQTDVEWDEASRRDFLSSISREADRLSDLVEKILDLSRLEASMVPIERETRQVADLIDGALQRRRGLLAGHPIHLELDPALPVLWVDGREMEVVLANLIENAAKYSAEGTPITIRVERRAREALLSVADQGIGLAPEYRERVFERFVRVPGAGHRSPGTGLGLAICKRIVEAHGGRIWVESEPGQGACFVISLPIGAEALPEAAGVEAGQGEPA